MIKEREEKKREIERSIGIKKSEQLRKVKLEFQKKLDSKSRKNKLQNVTKQVKHTLRTNLSQSRRKLGGYASGSASLASLHS